MQCATINPARHMRLDHWVGSIAPGRYADIVLLDDVASLSIAAGLCGWRTRRVEAGRSLEPGRAIDWPDWATKTMKIGREVTAKDFEIAADRGRRTMTAAVLRPFHWAEDFLTMDLPVQDGAVQRDPARNVTKFAIVDRFSGEARTSKMFWLGTGPRTPDTALACSMGHDKHNIWVTGSSDAAMALAVNTLQRDAGRLGAGAGTARYWPPCAMKSAG